MGYKIVQVVKKFLGTELTFSLNNIGIIISIFSLGCQNLGV